MKIIFSAQRNSWDSMLDKRFGRSTGFMLYDEHSGVLSWYSNEDNMNAAHGAGTKAAQMVINSGAGVLITGNVGPKAFEILKKTDIEIYNAEAAPLRSIYHAYKQGKLNKQFE
jgi:predicted Fe-Mo cluster-binding NifX family protein